MEQANIISNAPLDAEKIQRATQIILTLQHDLKTYITQGSGPFLAAIYDDNNRLIAQAANSVVNETCSHNHAEMNAIRAAEKTLNTFDLAPYNLSLYVTAEPCIMCLGGIMWSGIKNVYFGVPSKRVEEITGFDEGFKPDWLNEFKKRGISVYGNIEPQAGEEVLATYVRDGHKIYRPTR